MTIRKKKNKTKNLYKQRKNIFLEKPFKTNFIISFDKNKPLQKKRKKLQK